MDLTYKTIKRIKYVQVIILLLAVSSNLFSITIFYIQISKKKFLAILFTADKITNLNL